ncbi:MAG: WYL domain-containing protein [Chloroflexi bacterium]|nr:WYL domain-containing protein [Chloroflexota bacterium]
MNRLDRALGILLRLRAGQALPASELARHFEVSRRTIYRDIETLALAGVPVYAEMGRDGGFRLMEGYFLPPVMFSVPEAMSLLLGLALLRGLRASPLAAEQESGERKLLAVMPDHFRAALAEASRVIGFETVPGDAFHPERSNGLPAGANEGETVSVFLRAILDHRGVALSYHSPYGNGVDHVAAFPRGVLWDRGHWYLIGCRTGREPERRFWRADRVASIAPRALTADPDPSFDVRALLGRQWLQSAMQQWARESPVKIRLSRPQAERLRQDWYYGHARFDDLPDGDVLMLFGEDDRRAAFELLRWLGPGAELLEPAAWRAELRSELSQMLDVYTP